MEKKLETLRNSLRKELGASSINAKKCQDLFAQAKICLAQLNAFTPETSQSNVQLLLAARDILEMGAYYSVRDKDIDAFERYITQLNVFYHDLASVLPPSNQMYPLIGLHLLHLLSQNRLSDFHLVLESIDPEQLHASPHIKQSVDLEQYLMEGSYNKVWRTRNTVQGEEFIFFYDILMETIRNEIASCCEEAYEFLPLQDAKTLLFLDSIEKLLAFAKERKWDINASEKKMTFKSNNDDVMEIPTEDIITDMLSYARELERIV